MKRNKSIFSTDKEIKALKPRNDKYILTDYYTQGLQLIVRADGGKQWALRYSSPILKDKNGKSKQRQLGLGTYPTISLIEARNKANELKKEITSGVDPLEAKQELKSQIMLNDKSQFHKVVYQWIEEVISKNNTQTTANKIQRTFERDMYPYFCKYDEKHNIISSKSISEIHHSEILKAVKDKSLNTAETAKRILSNCNRIWIFAVSNGYCDYNVIANISSRDSLPKVNKKHYPKITDEKILGQLLRDIDNYKGNIIIRLALKLLPYTMLRAENLTTLKWEYIDFDKKILIIPRNLMKVKNSNFSDFVLPLTDSAIEILKEAYQITSWTPWVFCGATNINIHINPASINKALSIMGYDDEIAQTKQTIHSFRGTFRSLANTYQAEHNIPNNVREAVLDHATGSEVEKAYTHKADYTKQMRELLEWWEEFLDKIKK